MMIRALLTRLWRDSRGLAAVEYALLLGLIVLVMITALGSLANVVVMTWTHVNTQTQNAIQQANG
jgi:Flp pilus assembly pilin Flp